VLSTLWVNPHSGRIPAWQLLLAWPALRCIRARRTSAILLQQVTFTSYFNAGVRAWNPRPQHR